jgi:hypothetical protein
MLGFWMENMFKTKDKIIKVEHFGTYPKCQVGA